MKRTLFLVLSILFGISLVFAIFSIIKSIGNYSSLGDYLVAFIMLFVLVVLEMFFVKKYKKYSDPKLIKEQQKHNEQLLQEKWETKKIIPGSKARIEDLGADLCIKAKHMAGLPISEGAETFIYRCKNKVAFERNEKTYELILDKIEDITIKTDIEIQKSYVSSVGGAVGGYVLFGPLGAIVGGRAKEKKSQVIDEYLIFAYEKNNEVEYISFEVTNIPNASLFINLYDNKVQKRQTIEI
ncbi:hypothetical protein ACTHO0_23030 [Cytobacillus praedii]|uniref:hypothetical protein n=1 Tax=Cytobacillus praedii TaxID=1742358 RepID=UPI003F816C91